LKVSNTQRNHADSRIHKITMQAMDGLPKSGEKTLDIVSKSKNTVLDLRV